MIQVSSSRAGSSDKLRVLIVSHDCHACSGDCHIADLGIILRDGVLWSASGLDSLTCSSFFSLDHCFAGFDVGRLVGICYSAVSSAIIVLFVLMNSLRVVAKLYQWPFAFFHAFTVLHSTQRWTATFCAVGFLAQNQDFGLLFVV